MKRNAQSRRRGGRQTGGGRRGASSWRGRAARSRWPWGCPSAAPGTRAARGSRAAAGSTAGGATRPRASGPGARARASARAPLSAHHWRRPRSTRQKPASTGCHPTRSRTYTNTILELSDCNTGVYIRGKKILFSNTGTKLFYNRSQ